MSSIMNSKKGLYTNLFVSIVAGLQLVPSFFLSLPASADSNTATLSLSPSSQTVTTGSDITVTVDINPNGNSINTVQSVFSYPAADFSFVSASSGSSFGSFVDTPATGSVAFTSGTTTPVSGTSEISVATIKFVAKSTATTTFKLASICPAKDYALTCSAAYDSTTHNNDLINVGSAANSTVQNPAPSSTLTKDSHSEAYTFFGLAVIILLIYVLLIGSNAPLRRLFSRRH
jgi:hypothetical protein